MTCSLTECLDATPIICEPVESFLRIQPEAWGQLLAETQWDREWLPEPQFIPPKILVAVDPRNRLTIAEMIRSELGVLVRLRLHRDHLRLSEARARWLADEVLPCQLRRDLWLTGYDLNGPICWIDGRLQKMTWNFLAQSADTAYIPIPELKSEKMRRLFWCGRLSALLAAR